MSMLVSAWQVVSTETIKNCFRKCSISEEDLESSNADVHDPFQFANLQEDVDELRRLKPDEFPEDIQAEDVVCFNEDVVVSTQFSTDEEILSWAKGEDAEISNDEYEEEQVV